jgi:hypothetical protein
MRRRSLLKRSCGLAVLFATSSSSAQIFKCPINGVQVFQQAPCPGLGASGGRLLILANGRRAPPPTPEPESLPPPRVLGKTRLRTPTPVEGRKSP